MTCSSSIHRNADWRNHTMCSIMATLPRGGLLPRVVWQITVSERESTAARDGGIRASLSLLRRNRDFRRVYLASLISLGGDWFLLVALFGLVLDLTGSAVAVALLLAAEDLTYFIVSPVGGLLADRLDRRRLMVA